MHVDGQPVTINSGQQLGGSGGVAGDVTNDGVVSPGNSSGQLSIDGHYTQEAGGTLKMEIGGTSPDAFDLFAVSGTATLTGTLDVSLLNGFVPSPTDQFVILTAGSLQGQFANAPSSITTPAGTFEVTYSPTSVTLSNFTAVPEPGAAALAASLMGLGLSGRRGRRR